jgi:hypothetical protein
MSMGWDVDFSNVESRVVLQDRFFDGTEYYDTGIKLFSADAPDFTMAIETEFLDSNATGGTLVACY